MKKKLVPIFAMAALLFGSCSNTVKTNPDETAGKSTQPVAVSDVKPVTDILPAFKLKATDGSIINLADLKGKKVFVNLWATWCPPCKAEIPSIEKLYGKVDKANTVFVMISLDENFESAKAFAKANNMNLPVYYPAENLPAIFNTEGIPATFIFNEKSELIKVNNGMDEYDTEAYVKLLNSKG